MKKYYYSKNGQAEKCPSIDCVIGEGGCIICCWNKEINTQKKWIKCEVISSSPTIPDLPEELPSAATIICSAPQTIDQRISDLIGELETKKMEIQVKHSKGSNNVLEQGHSLAYLIEYLKRALMYACKI